LIRGDVGTQVSLIVARKGSQSLILVTITREIINLPIIDTKMIDDVFIINLYSFTENSPELFNTALQKFIESGSKKLIIDVRDNPGGFLNAAVDIASQFIYQGKVIAREYAGESLSEIVYRSSGTENIFPSNMKVVLLVNHGSASASEILAGALSEHNVATIVGTQTFGKGSVQELIPLSNGSSLKVTVAKWFTPNNVSLSDKGITPQHIVDISTDSDQDVILNKALQILK
jgi:carboxyl-terminal processing protease